LPRTLLLSYDVDGRSGRLGRHWCGLNGLDRSHRLDGRNYFDGSGRRGRLGLDNGSRYGVGRRRGSFDRSLAVTMRETGRDEAVLDHEALIGVVSGLDLSGLQIGYERSARRRLFEVDVRENRVPHDTSVS
jgi:hypothetical protein